MQAIKKILVPVDGSALSLARLDTAFNLSKIHDAGVTALCVMQVPQPSIFSAGMHAGWFMGEEMMARVRDDVRNSADQVKITCNQVAEKHTATFQWVPREGSFSDAIVDQARYHDVIVLGVPDKLNEPQLNEFGVDSALLSSGRPSLLLPGIKPALVEMPRNILFAWDGSRESLAALNDSAAFMAHADSVMVVTVLAGKDRDQRSENDNREMVDYLRTHHIAASGHVLPRTERQTVADVLVDYAEQSDCELMVLGAYGHSRFRELFLGGTTQDMLRMATLPVLFSH